MTKGSISKNIIKFAVPIFFGNVFQQLYNFVDSIILGNFVGKEALAAVTSSSSMIFLFVGFISGIFMGAGVVISRYYGAEDNATMSLGSVILTESTLSFLGLGAKYPIATWGQIINGVKDSYSLLHYTYIWIPVGMLICLTVIAFNFVGDGLRDAFDPKMKR